MAIETDESAVVMEVRLASVADGAARDGIECCGVRMGRDALGGAGTVLDV